MIQEGRRSKRNNNHVTMHDLQVILRLPKSPTKSSSQWRKLLLQYVRAEVKILTRAVLSIPLPVSIVDKIVFTKTVINMSITW